MHVDVWGPGAGPRVVLVHGAMSNGTSAWSKQRGLAERWELCVPSRRGFVPNPPEARSDFEADANDIAALLAEADEAAHLVGHSYGGLVALLAATQDPERVRSLTLVEPAVMSLMRGDPEVEQSIASHVAAAAARLHRCALSRHPAGSLHDGRTATLPVAGPGPLDADADLKTNRALAPVDDQAERITR